MKPLMDLGDQQRQILEILWSRGPSTVRWVREELDPDLAYTSVLSVLQKLTALGWVAHAKRGRAFFYRAALSQDRARREALEMFRQRVYGDDAAMLFQHVALGPDPERPLTLKSIVQHRQARAA